MADVRIEPHAQAVAELAAAEAWSVLTNALAKHGQAVWVLAGGRVPMAAYAVIAQHYADKLDWKRVTFAIGDERCVPFNHADSNWGQIAAALLKPLNIPAENCLVPPMDLASPEAAAHAYAQQFGALPRAKNGAPRLDLLWLGVGEDGHTLSLFPSRSEAVQKPYVVAVHESPKPPADRITLTFAALAGTQVCNVITAGTGKAAAVGRALQDDFELPIAQAVKVVSLSGGKVVWLLDAQAAGSPSPAPSPNLNAAM